jgi:hypothetical protein
LVLNAPKCLENECDLQRELAAPLPDVIVPIGTENLVTISAVLPLVESPDGEHVMVKLSHYLTEHIDMEWVEGSEMDTSFASHSLTGYLWQRFDTIANVLQLYHGQDLADPSGATIKRLRPDYCLWVNGALLLKAERKRDWKDLDVAKIELESKMNTWNPVALRGIPFLPCYAVGGRLIQFCALFPPAHSGARPQLRTVSDVFNMSTRFGRMWVMRISINMLRVLRVLRARLPSTVPMLYAAQKRSLGGYIMIMDDFVVKRCKPAAEAGIYECLDPDSESALPCSIRVVRRRDEARADGMEDLVIRPVCLQVLPTSVDELRAAIRCVVTALGALHARGFVHRDVRWPNVLRDRDLWLLSDFELAARDGAELPPDSIDPEYLPPEVGARGRYGAAGDMFCVGRLVRFWAAGRGGDIPIAARDLAARLVDADPDKRPSAAALIAEGGGWLNGRAGDPLA